MTNRVPIWRRVCDTTERFVPWRGRTKTHDAMSFERAESILTATKTDSQKQSKINPALSAGTLWDILDKAVKEGKTKGRKQVHFMVSKNIGREFGAAWLRCQKEAETPGGE